MKPILFISFLFSAFNLLSVTKEEAKEFLYNSLSLPDKTEYSEEFYNKSIDAAFLAKETMSWGEKVPDREFLHFVLPLRVNNEYLDTSRIVLFDALKDRIKDLSMEEAILEVNHWCHEHVTYQPSDGRTSSPLSTMSQAIGRCGEESTFTVAALRAVGIPARQIYTPRWAHTDDNHAWVEAWANGKWHFLGACEPEPVLDLAWFNAPASRGILMTTKVIGKYSGPEEILEESPVTTSINVTENYAPVSDFTVMVTDSCGNGVKGAKVNFCIYNYAEFSPVVQKISDSEGIASLIAGHGDMIVWASDGEKFGFSIGNPRDYNSSTGKLLPVALNYNKNFSGSFVIDIVPPVQGSSIPFVAEELRSLNEQRKAMEDSIRGAYMASFPNEDEAYTFAERYSLDKEKFAKIITRSRGNGDAIFKLITSLDPSLHGNLIALLSSVTEKDLRDISPEAVTDHILNTIEMGSCRVPANKTEEEKFDIFSKYILNPRIENEHINNWRSILNNGFTEEQMTKFREDPQEIIVWIERNIKLADSENPLGLRMTPNAVWESKKADKLSRKIFYVALARTAGLPARYNSVTHLSEYLDGDQWIPALFSEDIALEGADGFTLPTYNQALLTGKLKLEFTPSEYMTDPAYYSSFSISQIKDGIPQLLEYDEKATFSKNFATPVNLEAGQYILTTGRRLANGGVMALSRIFKILPDETTIIPIEVRDDENVISVIGNLNAENIYYDLESRTEKSILSTAGRGFYVLGLIFPNHEPSEHALNEISALKELFEKDNRSILLLFDDKDKASRFRASRFPDLPDNVVLGIDCNGKSKEEIAKSLNIEATEYPIFIIADSFNRIVWVSTGYNIGLGDRMISILSQVE